MSAGYVSVLSGLFGPDEKNLPTINQAFVAQMDDKKR